MCDSFIGSYSVIKFYSMTSPARSRCASISVACRQPLNALLWSVERKHLSLLAAHSPAPRDELQNYRNVLYHSLIWSELNYYHCKFHSCIVDVRKTWHTINGNWRCRTGSDGTVSLSVDGRVVSDPAAVAKNLNLFFNRVAIAQNRQIPTVDLEPISYVQ